MVRLFPDYAGTVIWFGGPVPYEKTHLDPELIEDLRGWERSYYAGLTPEMSWRTRRARTAFRTDGARLARRLASEIGNDFQVQHDLGVLRRRVRSPGPPGNPDAAAAFRRMADAARAEWSELRDLVDRTASDGGTRGWRAD